MSIGYLQYAEYLALFIHPSNCIDHNTANTVIESTILVEKEHCLSWAYILGGKWIIKKKTKYFQVLMRAMNKVKQCVIGKKTILDGIT